MATTNCISHHSQSPTDLPLIFQLSLSSSTRPNFIRKPTNTRARALRLMHRAHTSLYSLARHSQAEYQPWTGKMQPRRRNDLMKYHECAEEREREETSSAPLFGDTRARTDNVRQIVRNDACVRPRAGINTGQRDAIVG